MIDRDFEQASEEHMKSMTKPEGPAQEPQADPLGKWYCPKHKLRITDAYSCPECFEPVPATPAPSQPAGARELEEFIYDTLEYGRKWRKQDGYVVAEIMRKVEAQTAAKDAEIERLTRKLESAGNAAKRERDRAEAAERERDSLRAENAALKAGKDGQNV